MSRKLFIFLVLETFVTIMFANSSIDFNQWFEATKWLFGTYALANVGEHGADSIRSNKDV